MRPDTYFWGRFVSARSGGWVCMLSAVFRPVGSVGGEGQTRRGARKQDRTPPPHHPAQPHVLRPIPSPRPHPTPHVGPHPLRPPLTCPRRLPHHPCTAPPKQFALPPRPHTPSDTPQLPPHRPLTRCTAPPTPQHLNTPQALTTPPTRPHPIQRSSSHIGHTFNTGDPEAKKMRKGRFPPPSGS